jgi:hypothetical protein
MWKKLWRYSRSQMDMLPYSILYGSLNPIENKKEAVQKVE